jgi:hypothetical protein
MVQTVHEGAGAPRSRRSGQGQLRVVLRRDWAVHVNSQAFEGKGEFTSYDGEVQPDQALLLTPRPR